jgi:hypothetical protein
VPLAPKSQLALDLELVESIDVDSGLSDWEVGFVDSALRQLRSEKRELTARQRETAERIQRVLDARASR